MTVLAWLTILRVLRLSLISFGILFENTTSWPWNISVPDWSFVRVSILKHVDLTKVSKIFSVLRDLKLLSDNASTDHERDEGKSQNYYVTQYLIVIHLQAVEDVFETKTKLIVIKLLFLKLTGGNMLSDIGNILLATMSKVTAVSWAVIGILAKLETTVMIRDFFHDFIWSVAGEVNKRNGKEWLG